MTLLFCIAPILLGRRKSVQKTTRPVDFWNLCCQLVFDFAGRSRADPDWPDQAIRVWFILVNHTLCMSRAFVWPCQMSRCELTREYWRRIQKLWYCVKATNQILTVFFEPPSSPVDQTYAWHTKSNGLLFLHTTGMSDDYRRQPFINTHNVLCQGCAPSNGHIRYLLLGLQMRWERLSLRSTKMIHGEREPHKRSKYPYHMTQGPVEETPERN